MQQTKRVQTYFTDRAVQFDSLYADENALVKAFNYVFRKPMFLRYAWTIEAIGDPTGKRILDIGCGSGRYAVELAQRGATNVVGIDFSDEMIDMANKRAAEAGVADRVEFRRADFIKWASETDEHFDVAFAMGVLDYVDEAAEFVQLMAKVADEVMISWPTPTPIRKPLRELRYSLRGCPVYFYQEREIRDIHDGAGIADLRMRSCGPGFWTQARR